MEHIPAFPKKKPPKRPVRNTVRRPFRRQSRIRNQNERHRQIQNRAANQIRRPVRDRHPVDREQVEALQALEQGRVPEAPIQAECPRIRRPAGETTV